MYVCELKRKYIKLLNDKNKDPLWLYVDFVGKAYFLEIKEMEKELFSNRILFPLE